MITQNNYIVEEKASDVLPSNRDIKYHTTLIAANFKVSTIACLELNPNCHIFDSYSIEEYNKLIIQI